MSKKRILSAEELEDLREKGGSIIHEEKNVEVKGLKILADRLGEIAEANKILAEKDTKELVLSIKQLTEVIASKDSVVDLSSLEGKLDLIHKQLVAMQHKPAYEFEVERDNRRLMKRVVVSPINRSTH